MALAAGAPADSARCVGDMTQEIAAREQALMPHIEATPPLERAARCSAGHEAAPTDALMTINDMLGLIRLLFGQIQLASKAYKNLHNARRRTLHR